MKTLGQIAYEAYAEYSFGVALVTGILIPPWDELSDRVKGAWQMAAEAVVQGFESHIQ